MGVDRCDVLARTWGRLPDLERAAEQGWSSDYMARLRHVADAIGPSVELEDEFFPSVGVAEQIVRSCPAGTFTGGAGEAYPREPGRTVVSSAFTDVWLDAWFAGFIETIDGRAVPGPAYSGEADGTVARRTLRAVRLGLRRIDDVIAESGHGAGLVYLVVTSLWRGCSWVSVQEVVEAAPWPWFVDRSAGERAADEVRDAIRALAETDVLEVQGDRARLTSFGVWTVDSWLCQQFDPDAW